MREVQVGMRTNKIAYARDDKFSVALVRPEQITNTIGGYALGHKRYDFLANIQLESNI